MSGKKISKNSDRKDGRLFILDMGSGNTCRNDKQIVQRMIDRLFWVDSKRFDVVVKWQLFKKSLNGNIPLRHDVFDFAYQYANSLGYRTTSSVFDRESLDFLLNYDIPFVKISCNTDIDEFKFPNDMVVYKSIFDGKCCMVDNIVYLSCVPCYPADFEDYKSILGEPISGHSYFISDHTVDWSLFDYYRPKIYECHFKLPDSIGLDSGRFARTPDSIRRIME